MMIPMVLFSAVCAGMVVAGFRDLSHKPAQKAEKKKAATA
jgi:hypothetical protein